MTDASLEQIADAVLSPVDIRWIDKPRNRRKLVRREVEPRSCSRHECLGCGGMSWLSHKAADRDSLGNSRAPGLSCLRNMGE